jgi:hypothetical protein
LANTHVQKCSEKCLNFSIRLSIALRDGGRVQMESELQAYGDLFVLTSFMALVETKILFESFERAAKSVKEVARII